MSTRTLNLTDDLYDWLLAHGTREPEVARQLRERTATLEMARMQISPEQGQFMDFLVRALGVRRAIEVGTFTGYSSLRMALAMPEGGRLICCDTSETWTAIAREAWAQAGVTDTITLHLAPAAQTLQALIEDLQVGTFDLIFLDADKEGYAGYVDQAHALLRQGGVVLIDNVLWSGRVLDPDPDDPDTRALKALAPALHADERWDLCMLPLGDGLTLLRKR